MSQTTPSILLGLALLMAPMAASGDFLITLEGKLIETQGPWTFEDDNLIYTDLDNTVHQISLGNVDLEASEETTALRAGKPYVPSERARQHAGRNYGPKATLYVGWRCAPCEQTRDLLDRLDVDYTERNAEDHRPTAKQLRKKVGKRYILPVVEFEDDDKIVVGYRPREIRRIVSELEHQAEKRRIEKQREKPQDSEASEGTS